MPRGVGRLLTMGLDVLDAVQGDAGTLDDVSEQHLLLPPRRRSHGRDSVAVLVGPRVHGGPHPVSRLPGLHQQAAMVSVISTMETPCTFSTTPHFRLFPALEASDD